MEGESFDWAAFIKTVTKLLEDNQDSMVILTMRGPTGLTTFTNVFHAGDRVGLLRAASVSAEEEWRMELQRQWKDGTAAAAATAVLNSFKGPSGKAN